MLCEFEASVNYSVSISKLFNKKQADPIQIKSRLLQKDIVVTRDTSRTNPVATSLIVVAKRSITPTQQTISFRLRKANLFPFVCVLRKRTKRTQTSIVSARTRPEL